MNPRIYLIGALGAFVIALLVSARPPKPHRITLEKGEIARVIIHIPLRKTTTPTPNPKWMRL